ncbi:alpha/beta hydrolase [Vagococcus penaei]|uniref:Proline iminopeptidase n=1 Tax=Vagococcus penaei TaxID=633807 RepID=A0A1Q2D3V2_9ENTE|nr:proline iminopeptidase-family hydrolase [Vagococcus penaei]AQP52985.1 alpha/beta hydrolase [Vagococcus penaei]RSU02555.1 alpha/beta hydrolase [Vagococcus penaei]
MTITEGYMPYLGYQTYYRIVGKRQPDKAPLVLLHGGPGSTHNYFEVLDGLVESGHQLIMYDQLGCGLSSIPSNPDLWTAETWIEELIALRKYLGLDEIHLLGQSWGGMMAIQYICDYQPEGIKSLILSSTLPSSKLWATEQQRLIKLLPLEEQQAIQQAELTGDYTQSRYLLANDHFMQRHAADQPSASSPEPLRRKKQAGIEAYVTAWGPNEYQPTGTLKEFDYTNQLAEIKVPTLITSGTDDLCTPFIAKTMYDRIPNSRWELFQKSRHMPFVDEHKAYQTLLSQWLQNNR